MSSKRRWNRSAGGLLLFLAVFSVIGPGVASECSAAREASPPRAPSVQGESVGEAYGHEMLMGDLIGDIQVSKPTRDFMDQLYQRHRHEFSRIIQENPQMVWDALDIVLDALPALKSMPQNGGRLYLDREIYSRASGLVDQCEGLSTPELARDLKKLRLFVETRIRSADDDRILIDLQD